MYQYLEEELEQLKTRIIKMGTLVEEQVEFAVKALFEGNEEYSKIVIDRDDKVDKFDVKIERHCQKIFALTQPVAVDLRLIMAALSINKDLERIGDIAVNIAERVYLLKDHIELMKNLKVEEMATKTKKILKCTLDSFVNNDPEMGYSVIKSDSVIDKLDWEIFDLCINEMMNNKELIKPCSLIVSVARNLERLSDHCTNIAEEVIFLWESKIIKHRKNLGVDLESKPDIPD